MAIKLPRSQPAGDLTYGALWRSLAGLWREFGELRLAAVTQSLIFAAFTAFWTVLALRLQEPRFSLGADVAGLFGIVGAIGILATPLAGRIADKRGPHKVIAFGAVLTLTSWALFGLQTSVAGLVVSVIVLDFAVQTALVSNQHVVYALRPEARARLNTISMGAMFLGSAVGSATATAAWAMSGWTGVLGLGVLLSAIAATLQTISLF